MVGIRDEWEGVRDGHPGLLQVHQQVWNGMNGGRGGEQ